MLTRTGAIAAAFGVLLASLVFAQTPAQKQAVDAHIEKLVKQLASDYFRDRELAHRDLQQIGAPALGALRRAARGADLDTVRRIGDLVNNIEEPLLAGQILTPKVVHVQLKNASAHEAFAELSRVSGYTVRILEGSSRFRDKTITLDSGKTTFWQAFDQLCHATQCIERMELTARTVFDKNSGVLDVDKLYPAANGPRPILLQTRTFDGVRNYRYAGSVKFELQVTASDDRRALFLLFLVSGEPALINNTVVGWPTVETIVDDRGRKLTPALETSSTLTNHQASLRDAVAEGRDFAGEGYAAGRRFTVAFVENAPKDAKKFKEVAGTVKLQCEYLRPPLADGDRPIAQPYTLTVPFRFEDVWLP